MSTTIHSAQYQNPVNHSKKSKVKKAGSIKEKVELNIQVDNLKKEINIIKSKI